MNVNKENKNHVYLYHTEIIIYSVHMTQLSIFTSVHTLKNRIRYLSLSYQRPSPNTSNYVLKKHWPLQEGSLGGRVPAADTLRESPSNIVANDFILSMKKYSSFNGF